MCEKGIYAVPGNSLRPNEDYSLRIHQEEPHYARSPFERDRDRILYSKAFRRLAGKTQIFFSSSADHIRTRLTHALEVAQIASSIAARLSLNAPLTEAIAFGHDLGHTPFGHVGERSLNYIMNGCHEISTPLNLELRKCNGAGFKHNLQGLRVVNDHLQYYRAYGGINLTRYVMWGIANHAGMKWSECRILDRQTGQCTLYPNAGACPREKAGHLSTTYYDQYLYLYRTCKSEQCDHTECGEAWSFEALAVHMADEIAQRHHDIEDAYLAQIFDRDDVLGILSDTLGSHFSDLDQQNFAQAEQSDPEHFLSCISRLTIEMLVRKLVDAVDAGFREIGKILPHRSDFEDQYNKELDVNRAQRVFQFDSEFESVHETLQTQLRDRILQSYAVQRMDGSGSHVVRKLFKAYLTNPQQLPDRTIAYAMAAYNGHYEQVGSFSRKEIGEMRLQLSRTHDELLTATLARTIADHIACMTDDYALGEYHQLYGHQPPLRNLTPFTNW